VSAIAVANIEQNDGVNQINKGIQDQTHHTQISASSAEGMAEKAQNLIMQAEYLSELISFFKI
jgi:methyl-accepting chemotaxis protein